MRIKPPLIYCYLFQLSKLLNFNGIRLLSECGGESIFWDLPPPICLTEVSEINRANFPYRAIDGASALYDL